MFLNGCGHIVVIIIQEATELGKKAKELKKAADALRQEEKSGSKGRKWRKNVKAVEKVYLIFDCLEIGIFSGCMELQTCVSSVHLFYLLSQIPLIF